METSKLSIIKNIYFYLVSFVTLMIMVFSAASFIDTTLKTYVFTKADYYNPYTSPECDPNVVDVNGNPKKISAEQCAKQAEAAKQQQTENRIANLQRSAATSISYFVIALPIFIFHWFIIRRKERE